MEGKDKVVGSSPTTPKNPNIEKQQHIKASCIYLREVFFNV